MAAYLLLFLFNIITLPLVNINQKRIYLTLNGIVLWLIMGLRGFYVGADTPSYVSVYNNIENIIIPHKFVNWFFPKNTRFENGYLIFNKVLHLINSDPRFLLIIYTLICVICLLFMIDKLSINPIIGIIAYEAILMPFMMNGIRQAIAISLCMVAFVFAVEKKLGYFLLFNYLAISMHATAFMFLIVYLLNYIGNDMKSKVIISGIIIAIFVSFDDIYYHLSLSNDEMQSFLPNGQSSSGATNIILTVFVSMLVLIVSNYLGKKYRNLVFNKIQIKSYIFSKYLVLFIALFMIIALRSSQLSRIALYFEIGLIILLSSIYSILRHNKSIIMSSLLIVALFSYFIVIQLVRPEWSAIVPYVFIN